MKKLSLFFLLFLLIVPFARGQVTIGGTDYGSDLQAAINAAADNDVITITGTLNVGSNIDIGAGTATLTIHGESDARIIFTAARFIFEQGKTRLIENMVIDGDSTGDRGAVFKLGNAANLTLDGVTVSGGRSGSHGGAIANSGSTLVIRNSTFNDNKSALSGGAIFTEGNGSVSLYNSKFTNNWCAAFAEGADGKGGAVAMVGSNSPGFYAEGCLFYQNNSRNHGGVFIFESSTGLLVNCTLAKNRTSNAGGVAFLWGPVTLRFVNSTLAYNITGGNTDSPCIKNIHNTNTLEFNNCILYENRDENGLGNELDVQSDIAHTITVNNSIISGYSNNLTINGTGNITGLDIVNPALAAVVNAEGALEIAPGSQAVNLGNAGFLVDLGVTTDQVGKTRNFAGGKVDAGAFEVNGSQGAGYVTLNGTSYGTDFGGAMIASADGDTIKVYGLVEVTSSKDMDAGGAKVVVKGYNGATFKFTSTGAPGTGSRLNWATNANYERTFKDIDFIGDPNGQSDAGAILNITKAGTLYLENVTMSGGISTLSHGGAIRITGNGAMLRANNCQFIGNKAWKNGGAIYINNSAGAVVKNSRFIHNQAALMLTDGKGGAIGVNGSAVAGLWVENCSFYGNRSFNHGGVFLIENAKATVINSTMYADTAKVSGGIAFIWSTSNVTFINNTAAFNVTFASQNDGAGLRIMQAVNTVSVRNCYFYKNKSVTDDIYQDITSNEANTNIVLSGTVLSGGYNANTTAAGGHNVIGSALVKPGISEALNGDMVMPLTDSLGQAINLGDTVGIGALIKSDQRNQPRDFVFGKVDAGAYEMQGVTGKPPVIWPDNSAHMSYSGLSMTGYQGWFSAQGDGSGQNWVHYAKGGSFAPGSCVIDFWPDMREASDAEKFATPFLKGDDTAYVFSPYVPATVNRHFQWMKQYGVDGAFMQRFVVDIMNPATKARLNQVLKNALQSAKANGRAISVMYDLSGIDTTSRSSAEYLQIIKDDWNELKNSVGIADYGDGLNGENQPLLYHPSKGHGGNPYPVVTIWGAGFNDDRKYNIGFISRLVDFFQNDEDAGQCAVMLGVPTYWRTAGNDVVTGEEYTRLITLMKRVDIILPWHTGRFNRTDFTNGTYKNLVTADVAWCETNGVDYAPVISPGFSWKNLKGDAGLAGKPREEGYYYWDMAKAAVEGGVEMLYTGMFDEINEGTQIFKVDNNPPQNTIPFLTYTPNAEDHYLWISGEVRRGLVGETTMGSTLPTRASESGFVSTYSFIRSDSVEGRTFLALQQAADGHKIYYADPYSVPDGAPTVNISRDTSIFNNELVTVDTLDLSGFNQYLRIVEVDADDKVVAFKAVLLDKSLVGNIADSTGFTDADVNFRASYTHIGQTVLAGNPDEGNSYWAAPAQASTDFPAIYYRTVRDTNVFNITSESLAEGIPASEGDFIPVIEVNSDDEVLGFKVFRISKPQIGRLINPSTDLMHSSLLVTYPGVPVNVKVTTAEGYIVFRTAVSNSKAEVPFYGAPYEMYADVYPNVAVTANHKYVTGQMMTFIEVKDGAIVAYKNVVFNPIPPVSAELVADPDLNTGKQTVISIAEPADAGHHVYIYPKLNPTDETPRIGTDYAELAPIYSEEVDETGIALPAKADDFYYIIETDEGNAVVGFTSFTLTESDISIFADPAIHPLESAYSISVIGETSDGKIDVAVTPAAGKTVYISDVLTEPGRIPVYTSKTENNPELNAYASPVSLTAAMGNGLIIAEYDAAGELTGIAIEEAKDSLIAVYYVSEFGDDSYNGSKYRPFKTLEKALQNVTRVVSLDSAATIYVTGTIQMQAPAVEGTGTQITASVKVKGLNGATLVAANNNRVLELIDAKFYFENVTITGGNTANTGGGAGIYLHGNRNTYAEFKNCKFVGNITNDNGGVYAGGIRIVGSNARFTSCTFEGNQGRNRGGAIGVSHGSHDNTADYNVVFDGCYIANNLSKFVGNVEGHGGGVFISNSDAGRLNVDFINSVIQNNEAKSAGGAMFVEGSSLSLTKVRLINSSVTDNKGQNTGNGHGIRMVGAADNTLEIYNSLIWDNIGGTDGSQNDIRNDAGTVITCQQSYVETVAGGTLTGVYKTDDQPTLGVVKAPLPAGNANSLFINNASSFAVNYGNPTYLTAAGVDYDATFKPRNATDGNIEAGPTEYDPLKFDKGPEIGDIIADMEVEKNAEVTSIDISNAFTDRDGDPFTWTITANNNPAVVSTEIVPATSSLNLSYMADMEGDAFITLRGTTNNKFAEQTFKVSVGYAPYVVNPVDPVSIPHKNGGSFSIDMSDVFADPDDDASEIELNVIGVLDEALIPSASFDGKTLNYNVAAGDEGVNVITVRAKAGIRTALTTVMITIGVPPEVVNPIPGVAVLMNSAPVTRDLTNTFNDPDGEGAPIEKTVEGNSNPALVTPSISGNTLTFTFAAGKTGTSVVTISAKSGDLTVTTTVNVVVTNSNQLIVLNPIQPVKVEKDAADYVIDLSDVFYNMADPEALITITVSSNSNADLVSTSISGSDLTLSFAANSEGVADITLHAVSGSMSVDHLFKVAVGDIDLMVVSNPITDLQIGNDPSEETVIPLADVFEVVGKPDAEITYDLSYTNPLLLNAYINNQTKELVISAAGATTGSCVFTLTGNYGNASISTQFTVTILATAIHNLDADHIRIYPVPVNSVLYCEIGEDEELIRSISNLQIISLSGMVVKSFDSSIILNGVAEMNVVNLASGSYLLRIISKKGYATKMFVK